MRVLLRQSHSFQGFGAVQVLPKPDRPSLPDGPDVCHARVNLSSAFPPPSTEAQKDGKLSAGIEDILDVDREIFEEVKHLFPISSDCFTPAMDRCIGRLRGIVRLDLGIHHFQRCVQVSASERLIASPKSVDVLL